jgi:hypothetical protein
MTRKTRRKPSAPSIRAAAKSVRTMRRKLSQAKVARDTATATAETIAYRAAMIGRELANPAGLSHPEIATMTFEKVVVAGQVATAMLRQLGTGQRLWTDFWFQQMQRSLAALPQMAAIPSSARAMQIAAASAGTMMADWTSFWFKAAAFTDAAANAGTKPVHRAVMANAKRLSRAA